MRRDGAGGKKIVSAEDRERILDKNGGGAYSAQVFRKHGKSGSLEGEKIPSTDQSHDSL
jgi:hypothetical protein